MFGQRFDSAGNPAGTEFLIPTTTTGSEQRPSVAMTDNGDFVVVWESHGFSTGFRSILGQRFDAGGTPNGTEFVVASCGVPCFEYSYYPDVDYRGNDRFAVVWQRLVPAPSVSKWDVYGRLYDAAGLPEGSAFLVNAYTTDRQRRPAIDANDNGSFVVAWQGSPHYVSSYPGYNHVFARRFDVNGFPTASEFQVTFITYPYPNYHQRPAVGINDDMPADKEKEGILDSETHLTRYSVKGATNQSESLVVTNQFGTFRFAPKRTKWLMVPTATSPVGFPPPGLPSPSSQVDHYRCIKVRELPSATIIGPISVVDTFAARTLSNLRARELCIATDKNGEGMKNPEAHLLCYKGKSSAKPPNAVLQTQDQFAATPDRQVRREREFCVPSTVSSR